MNVYSAGMVGEGESAMWDKFGCGLLPKGGGRESKERRKRREECSRTTERFVRAMSSDNPPRNESEAIQKVAPLAGWLVSWLIQTFAVEIVKALWSWWNAKNPEPVGGRSSRG